ncbi:sensor histidine kinase [Porphyrobacter sp. ULC335]|uniref:sensor histidine kinase n=1 Tax=Porphyrobacter sp. ULC335 TaxID=2854260 RepID=UPI002220D9AC|nr:HAMP domain-containing sensor histidine kinase [Porphyrobacter sp. ULC335]UYV16699.1 HAMP domain-containing histidine kinase [Porphyrobacter sp. ULC335]
MTKLRSLRRPLIIYPLAVNFAILIVSFAIIIAIAIRFDSGGPYTDERIIPVIAGAIKREEAGQLSVEMTPELAELQAATPQLWFVVQDDAGRSVSFGSVPQHYASLVGRLSDLSFAQLRDRNPPYHLAAVARRQKTEIGDLTILGHGALSDLNLTVILASNVIVLPIFVLLALTSLVVTPWIVRRSLAGVHRIAREAEAIDAHTRRGSLSEDEAPREIAPLVSAFNAALQRLDEDHERQRRFLGFAAHELRTPIAVLRSKVETSENAETRSLAGDIQRLATLAEQLLDLQRMENHKRRERFDLAALVRATVAELAPLMIASGKTVAVEVAANEPVLGDPAAIERVVMNLVQNAAQHGGQQIIVRVTGVGFEVEDDGPGIPPGERERIFEPFYRLRPSASGSGLGLSLVEEVIARHDGRVDVLDAPGGGTLVRVGLRAEPSAG